jgi:hypothetical protein
MVLSCQSWYHQNCSVLSNCTFYSLMYVKRKCVYEKVLWWLRKLISDFFIELHIFISLEQRNRCLEFCVSVYMYVFVSICVSLSLCVCLYAWVHTLVMPKWLGEFSSHSACKTLSSIARFLVNVNIPALKIGFLQMYMKKQSETAETLLIIIK